MNAQDHLRKALEAHYIAAHEYCTDEPLTDEELNKFIEKRLGAAEDMFADWFSENHQ